MVFRKILKPLIKVSIGIGLVILIIIVPPCYFMMKLAKGNYQVMNINVYQLQRLEQAKNIIFKLDPGMQQDIEQKTVQYVVLKYPWYEKLPFFNWFGCSYYGYANEHNDDTYRVALSEPLFFDFTALVVYLYHELQHVKITDFSLTDPVDKCEDHNAVKQATTDFVNSKLMEWYELEETQGFNSYHPPSFYARNSGNIQQNCGVLDVNINEFEYIETGNLVCGYTLFVVTIAYWFLLVFLYFSGKSLIKRLLS